MLRWTRMLRKLFPPTVHENALRQGSIKVHPMTGSGPGSNGNGIGSVGGGQGSGPATVYGQVQGCSNCFWGCFRLFLPPPTRGEGEKEGARE